MELCGAIWNTHECASHLPAHRSKALLLPAMHRPGFLPSPLRAQRHCPQTTIENLREPCRITHANHCKFRVIQSLITWNVESCGTMWTPSNPRTLNGRRIKSFRRLQAEPVPPKPKAGAASPVLSSGCRRTSENHQTHIDIHRPTQSRR